MFKGNKKDTVKVIEPPVIMDTSAIIDGRVLAVAKSGFIPNRLIVAQFVIAELQQLADGSNSFKRERARFGMDVIKDLQELKNVRVIINRDKFPNIEEVDDKLVALAKQEKGFLFTTDYNLGKVAEIEGLKVLNVNELAQSLRPVILPGETLEVKVIQRGSERGQGIAYLDDGTMVVVENGSKLVGKKVKIEFSRTLQTVAGKMMFATIVKSSPPVAPSRPKSSRPRQHSKSVASKPSHYKHPKYKKTPPPPPPKAVNGTKQAPKPTHSKPKPVQKKSGGYKSRRNLEDSLMNAVENEHKKSS